MKPSIEKLIDKAEESDWNVTVYKNYITFRKFSPAGQDFYFDIDVTDFEVENNVTAAELVLNRIRTTAEDFDPSYEAYIWLDNDGHGKNGAPYDMRDVYDDMEACRDMVDELFNNLLNYYIDELWEEFNYAED